MSMTKAQAKAFRRDPSKCPFCKSDDIDSSPLHDGDTPRHQNFAGVCNVCRKTWVEVYKLEKVFEEDEDGDK